MATYTSSQQTCENLIRATGELAAELGFTNVSTRAIAKRAKANLGSIHYHFGGKHGLFKAVVMRVLEYFHKGSIDRCLKPLQPVMHSREGQIQAIRAIVQKHIRTVFDNSKPDWYSKVLYQVMQYDNPLRELVYKEFVEPDDKAVFKVLDTIKPELKHEEKVLLFLQMFSLVITHSAYSTAVLRSLGRSEYDATYLDELEKYVVRSVLLYLGLAEAK